MYFIYRLFSYFIFSESISKMILNFRFENNKETSRSIAEKMCYYDVQRPKGRIIWIHAASVGEMKSVIPLIKYVQKKQKVTFLISSCTLTSARLFEKLNLEDCQHIFAPLDNPSFVKDFLDKWKPDLGIFVDSELWPNLVVESSKRLPLISVNTRLSDKSFKRWKKFRGLARFLLSKFQVLSPVSELDKEKITYFVDEDKITYCGNLKDSADPIIIEKELQKFKKAIKKKHVFLAASTHKGEDSEIIEAYLPFKKKYLLVIVPKHPSRSGNIESILQEYNLSYTVRSSEEELKLKDVYIADTIGELDLFYLLADISFVGGSLVKHGGQNFVEAAKQNSLVLIGPHTSNFKNMSDKFLDSKAAILVKHAKDISDVLLQYSRSPSSFKKSISKAKSLSKSNSKVIPKLYNVITKYLRK